MVDHKEAWTSHAKSVRQHRDTLPLLSAAAGVTAPLTAPLWLSCSTSNRNAYLQAEWNQGSGTLQKLLHVLSAPACRTCRLHHPLLQLGRLCGRQCRKWSGLLAALETCSQQCVKLVEEDTRSGAGCGLRFIDGRCWCCAVSPAAICCCAAPHCTRTCAAGAAWARAGPHACGTVPGRHCCCCNASRCCCRCR